MQNTEEMAMLRQLYTSTNKEAGITPELEVYTAEDPESAAAVKLFTKLGLVESNSTIQIQNCVQKSVVTNV